VLADFQPDPIVDRRSSATSADASSCVRVLTDVILSEQRRRFACPWLAAAGRAWASRSSRTSAPSGEPLDLAGRTITLTYEDAETKAARMSLQLDNLDLAPFERATSPLVGATGTSRRRWGAG
jgi:hypothetical protein